MFGRKGQGAMEYLMTYGWAILVVMIVGVVLWQLGIFGGGPGAVNTASGFAKIKPMEPSIRYVGTGLTFSIMNGAGQGITSAAMVSTGGDCHIVSSNIYPETKALGTGGAMRAGEVSEETVTGCNTKIAGQSFSVSVNITYSTTVAGIDVSHTDFGTIRGNAE